jgi:hypothetical protein
MPTIGTNGRISVFNPRIIVFYPIAGESLFIDIYTVLRNCEDIIGENQSS